MNHISPLRDAPPPASFAEPIDFKTLALFLRRKARFIFSITLSAACLALILALTTTPLYRAEALVMLDPHQTRVVDIEDVLSPVTASAEIMRSKLDILRSRAVIDRVIDSLNLADDPELNPPLHIWAQVNPSNWAQSGLSDQEKTARIRSYIAQLLMARMAVDNDGRSYVIHIGFLSADPRKAARIANAIADAFLADEMDAKYRAVTRANDWLNSRLGALKTELETSEKAVETYRENNRLIALNNGETLAAKQMDDINAQLSIARGDSAQAEAKLQAAQAMLKTPGGIDGVSDVLASPLIQDLRSQEADLRRAEADLSAKYGPLHPKMITIHAQYRDLQNKIAEETQKIIQGLANQAMISRARQAQLEHKLDDLVARAGVEMKDSVELRHLQREVEANRGLYESFLNRYKQTSEQSDLQLPDSRLIAAAEIPLHPAVPHKTLYVLIGLLLGALCGVAAAYGLEYMDKTYRHSGDLEAATGRHVLGVIPDLSATTPALPEDYVALKPLSGFVESLRRIRAAIQFAPREPRAKLLMITSSAPQEGKTSFCLSLARDWARSGARILLIDADLRRSRLARTHAEVADQNGLADVLAGKTTLAEAVRQDRLIAGLSLLLSLRQNNPAEDLLSAPALRALLTEAANMYDYVLVDTPPVLALSDAAIIGRFCDACIFLVKWAETPRDDVRRALKYLTSMHCEIAGLVLTQVDLAEHARYSESSDHNAYTEYYMN